MSEPTYVLFGSGTTGRVIARNFSSKGIPFVFADSDSAKQNTLMGGVQVFIPNVAKDMFRNATWIASTIIPEFHKEITAEIERLGVKTVPVWGFLPQRNTPPPPNVAIELRRLVVHDALSFRMVNDQIAMRNDPEHHIQEQPDDIKDIYFPEFIAHLDSEVFWDAGGADGDTVLEFIRHWKRWAAIEVFEPDAKNFEKLVANVPPSVKCRHMAVGDETGSVEFTETGDYSAHIGGDTKTWVPIGRLDRLSNASIPTYIKADIEGSEPEMLWGARRILRDHKPVLAICAYHEAEHFWTIPMLIHTLQPEYRIYYRRYAAGSFEQVWYAVPKERIK